MPRPQRCRMIRREPEYRSFSPAGTASGENVVLTADEYVIIRLADPKRLTHSQAAEAL